MTGSTVVKTKYSIRNTHKRSLGTSLSDRDDMARKNEQEQIVCEDFVPPPSCWFENHPVADTADENRKHLVVDDSGIGSDFHVHNSVIESTSNHTDTSKTIPSTTGTIILKSSEINLERKKELKEETEEKGQYNFRREVGYSASTGLRATALPISPGVDVVVGNTRPSPSWGEISSQVLPAAAKELLSSSVRRFYYTAKKSYSRGRWYRKYSDMGQNAGGFSIGSSSNLELPQHLSELPPFSNLSWIDRQLVREWRTYLPETPLDSIESEDYEFEQARTLVPNPIPRPIWKNADVCYCCHKPFGPVRLRHHCRSCGHSFCQDHSLSTHRLPHLGYVDVPERVCDSCKRILDEQNLAERIAWRLARCRDYNEGRLTPYFETGIDSVEDVALRVAQAAIAMAKSVPLGAQATVAVETVDVLRKYGLHGIYGIMLRQEFLAAADLLRKALGINKTSWPLSVHELSAAIFYALAQHRAMRGLSPEREELIHRFRSTNERNHEYSPVHDRSTIGLLSAATAMGKGTKASSTNPTDSGCCRNRNSIDVPLAPLDFHNNPVIDEFDTLSSSSESIGKLSGLAYTSEAGERSQKEGKQQQQFNPVCDPVPTTVLGSLLFYAPIALNFIYAPKEVEMQLLAAQQGWRLLYAFLHQEKDSFRPCDRPASAIFLHQEHKIVCLSVRGTATINDVITDIRQTPVTFPNTNIGHGGSENDGDWTTIDRGKGLALSGMASAASNLFYEHIDTILNFVKQGYRVRLVGHSLGGGVATMIGVLVLRHLEELGYSNDTEGTSFENVKLLKVYAYGTPSCFDAKLADSVDSFVTTVVLHDDVFPRLTPTSCRGLLKHLLYIRETWVKAHIEEDLRAVGERAKTAWAPRFRQNFALRSSSSSIKKYYKKQILRGKSKLACANNYSLNKNSDDDLVSSMRGLQECDSKDEFSDCIEIESSASDPIEWGEKFYVPTINLSMTNCGEEKVNDAKDTDMNASDNSRTQLLLEFLGGGDNRSEGIIIDGDEFFETGEKLDGESDGTSESVGDECFNDPVCELRDETIIQTGGSWSLDMHKSEASPSKNHSLIENDDENDHAAVVLDESPLPQMFLPGRIVHIYSHRGVYKAAYVPRTFTEFRRISLAGNMLSNHTTKSYFESLLEVQTSHVASESPPRWTAYDEDDTCSCCANRFTWASTSNSEAQEARDKHNCRSCGGLICDPCSKNRVPIPSIGLTVPVRVCDRCYNDIMGGVSAASPPMSSCVFTAKKGYPVENNFSSTVPHEKKKPERTRQKRSAVVDDLVSRMRSSALT